MPTSKLNGSYRLSEYTYQKVAARSCQENITQGLALDLIVHEWSEIFPDGNSDRDDYVSEINEIVTKIESISFELHSLADKASNIYGSMQAAQRLLDNKRNTEEGA